MSNPVSQLAKAALDTLHGARGLPPAEAIAKLHDFLDYRHLCSGQPALCGRIRSPEDIGKSVGDGWDRDR
jgi:hypothetical protein